MGLFAYYAKWIPRFSERISKLKAVNSFPFDAACLADLEFLKTSIADASLQAIDESQPFVVECDASDVAVSPTQPKWTASGVHFKIAKWE